MILRFATLQTLAINEKKRRSAQTASRNQRQQDIRSRVYLQSWVG